jgi:hypothetical protein
MYGWKRQIKKLFFPLVLSEYLIKHNEYINCNDYIPILNASVRRVAATEFSRWMVAHLLFLAYPITKIAGDEVIDFAVQD